MADQTPITIPPAEEWRPVEGWPYEVSNLGRVRRSGKPTNGTSVGRIRLPHFVKGYEVVGLRDGERRQKFRVNRLVCIAFNGPPPSEGHMAMHIDGSRRNNLPHNLRWGTNLENVLDARRHGTFLTKLSEASVLEIRRKLSTGYRPADIARLHPNIDRTTIYDACRGDTWRHVTEHSEVIPPAPHPPRG